MTRNETILFITELIEKNIPVEPDIMARVIVDNLPNLDLDEQIEHIAAHVKRAPGLNSLF